MTNTYCFIQISINHSEEYPIDKHESVLFTKAGLLADDVEEAVKKIIKEKYPEFEFGRAEVA